MGSSSLVGDAFKLEWSHCPRNWNRERWLRSHLGCNGISHSPPQATDHLLTTQGSCGSSHFPLCITVCPGTSLQHKAGAILEASSNLSSSVQYTAFPLRLREDLLKDLALGASLHNSRVSALITSSWGFILPHWGNIAHSLISLYFLLELYSGMEL